MARAEIQLPQDTKDKGIEQASKLGLNFSEYVRLLIHLDPTVQITKLKEPTK